MKRLKFSLVLLIALISSQLTASVRYIKKSSTIVIDLEDAGIEEVFREIETQTNYAFIYNQNDIDTHRRIDVMIEEPALEDALDKFFDLIDLEYEIYNDNIIVKKSHQQPETTRSVFFEGRVADSEGLPLPGVNVITSNKRGTVTNFDGIFMLELLEGEEITLSFIGMISQTITVPKVEPGVQKITRLITMLDDEQVLGEVVANGYFVRKKETYTGNTNEVSGDELITMGTKNVMESLNILDPSFQILENNDMGSNPNAKPEIRFRGTSSFSDNMFDESDRNLIQTDPNQPTFIMDGFQVTLQDVMDLDMYRVESITILKDAVAASIYGARAANGVIVIKTKKPEKGQLRVTYNLNLGFEAPDLSTYNMLSGPELFELQKNLGLYSMDDPNTVAKFNQINRWLYEGVNTDWMSQPVTNAVTQRHSLQLSGGSDDMRYSINFGYSDNPGVMKGSFRNNNNVNVNLNYNLNEKLQFAYLIGVNKNKNDNGPYGSFSDYAHMPNYFPMYDRFGNLQTTFKDASGNEAWGSRVRYNPLAEAQMNNFNRGNYLNVINNFSANYQLTSDLRINTTLAHTMNRMTSEQFLNPNSLDYISSNVPIEQRGKYTKDNTDSENIDFQIMANYMKMIDKHHFSISAGSNLTSQNVVATGFVAQGFSDDNWFPSHSNGYEINGMPRGQETLSRMAGFMASGNYSYKNTYMLDATFRADGSSAFGSDNLFAPFFSIGAGWNLHNETWMKELGWISNMRLRATYGETGSIAFSPYQSNDMFAYLTEYRYLDEIGVSLKALGNEALVWQTTIANEIGMDASLFKRVDINFSVYKRTTKDLIAPLDLPPSLGFQSMTANIGTMENKGFDFSTRTHVIRQNDHNVFVSISGAHNKNKLVELNGGLKSYNDRAESEAGKEGGATRFVSRYNLGGSMSDLYAVRSLGIDPETGKELYLDKNGNPTWEWSSSDMVVVGNTLPTLEGAIILSYNYKRLNVNINSIYRLGGQAYNNTLLDKVENSDKYMNVDYRVLEDTWQKPGDQVAYRANVGNERTYASSRFIQDNNVFHITGINLTYMVPQNFCDKLNMKSMNVGFNLNDILYMSTILRERGTSYPFARSFTFNLSTNF